MGERKTKTAYMEVELEDIPGRREASQEEWEKWCEDHDFTCLGNHAESRRAWISSLSTYIRGAAWLVYSDGGLVDLAYKDDVGDTLFFPANIRDAKRHADENHT